MVKRITDEAAELDPSVATTWSVLKPLKEDEGSIEIVSQGPSDAEVVITAGTTTGRHSTTIHYGYGERECLSRIEFDVQAPVVAEPNALAVTLRSFDETPGIVERTIRLDAASGGDVEIASIRCDPAEWLVDWTAAPEPEAKSEEEKANGESEAPSVTVTIRLKPSLDSVVARGTLSLATTVDAEEHVVTVPVSVLKLPKSE